jgi:3-ketosteroid 9alpha-monooxygenase subunit A
MDEWRNLMPSAELEPGAVLELQWQENDLLLFRTRAGKCQAISAYCPHQGNYMPNGLIPGEARSKLLVEDELRCPFHGWRFNGAGQCTHIPQGQRVPAIIRAGKKVIRSWKIRDTGLNIQICAD